MNTVYLIQYIPANLYKKIIYYGLNVRAFADFVMEASYYIRNISAPDRVYMYIFVISSQKGSKAWTKYL